MIQLLAHNAYFSLHTFHNNITLAVIYITLASYATLALAQGRKIRPIWECAKLFAVNVTKLECLSQHRLVYGNIFQWPDVSIIFNRGVFTFSDVSTVKLPSVLSWNNASSSVRAALLGGCVVVRVRHGGQPTKRCRALSKTTSWREWLVKYVSLKYRVGFQPRDCCSKQFTGKFK